MSQIAVRAARASDEPAILALVLEEMRRLAGEDPRWRPRDDVRSRYALHLRERSRNLDAAVFVAEAGGVPVGLVVASVHVRDGFLAARRFGHVSDLLVAPGHRRRGVGRALWTRAAGWLRALGIADVRVHVAARDERARAFWAAVGADEFLVEASIGLDDGERPGPGGEEPR